MWGWMVSPRPPGGVPLVSPVSRQEADRWKVELRLAYHPTARAPARLLSAPLALYTPWSPASQELSSPHTAQLSGTTVTQATAAHRSPTPYQAPDTKHTVTRAPPRARACADIARDHPLKLIPERSTAVRTAQSLHSLAVPALTPPPLALRSPPRRAARHRIARTRRASAAPSRRHT